MMLWSTEQLGISMLSDRGYRITCQPMARGGWFTAFTPGGKPIASGQLDRCRDACEKHLVGEVRGKGKREYRPQKRPRSAARLATA